MFFQKAKPVWLAGCAEEMNVTGGLYAAFTVAEGDSLTLSAASSTFFHLYIDGEPFAFGPTRCAHGFFRVDEWTLSLTPGKHHLAAEVLGYHINGFDTLDQPVFIQLELCQNGNPLVFTDTASDTVCAYRLHDRVQKVQRYDFQRGFAEAYHLKASYAAWRVGGTEETVSRLEAAPSGTLLPRSLPLYRFPVSRPETAVCEGRIRPMAILPEITTDRSVALINKGLKGFTEEQMELYVSKELLGLESRREEQSAQPYDGTSPITVATQRYRLLKWPLIKTGFLCFTVTCTVPSLLFMLYDEVLVDGDIQAFRQNSVNAVRLELEPGEYRFQSADPMTLQYLKAAVLTGECRISDIHLRELSNPLTLNDTYPGTDPAVKKIYDAAVETFRQNSPDIFMDCPTRERAGWLCDSYFTAETEFWLTGENRMEKLFLENYLLPERFSNVPDGMIPMCYPADHYDRSFIPNWAMWFVLELREYLHRTHDRELIDRARQRVYGILNYFSTFFNEDGLLERLDGWIFVEWSAAAGLVQDVNYPTNMLYAAVLQAAGEMYGDEALTAQAATMQEVIRKQSFNGTFFEDNAVRVDGRLQRGGVSTEVCQYYAFFFGTASREQYGALWEALRTQFTPNRDVATCYPQVEPVNQLPGVTLRNHLLAQYGESAQLVQEIVDRLTFMVDETGTLWENMLPSASCIHGFASYVAPLLAQNDPTVPK